MITQLKNFLKTSYTAYQAVENAKNFLLANGFTPLDEGEPWNLKAGGKYFVTRNQSSLIAFRCGDGPFKIVASHTDSPCFKLKDHAVQESGPYSRLNVEEYGGCILYSFFDRPLRLAGRVMRNDEKGVKTELYVSNFCVTVPSLAVHMNRDVNDGFKPDRQNDMEPLLGLGKRDLDEILGENIGYDLFAVPDVEPYESGASGEFLSSPRIDNLTSVYGSLLALADDSCVGNCLVACFDNEEIGSRTRQGAAGDFLKSVISRISAKKSEIETLLSQSFLVSLDNAHAVHPNRPEKCDPTNQPAMGGGIVIKGHAGGAYTTDGLTAAVIKKIFSKAGVKYQSFYNRSDMRSGSTLGAISLTQESIPSVDLGLAQLAMHSAVETMAKSDFEELVKGLTAVFSSHIAIRSDGAEVE